MSSLPSIEKEMNDLQLLKIQERGKLEMEYNEFRDEYSSLRKRLHELSDLKIKKADEIAALTTFITSLK
jgi:predicted nuclease with TOPRIM domain